MRGVTNSGLASQQVPIRFRCREISQKTDRGMGKKSIAAWVKKQKLVSPKAAH
jgi:hypothetical protein